MTSRFLDLLRERVLFFDGGMGTQLQARELKAGDFGGARWEGCFDHLSLTRPDVVEAVHAAYFEAGADVVETNSFQASRVRLEEWELGEKTLELNRAAAAIARRVADRFERADGRPRFVAGSMGPSGYLPSSEDPELGRLGLEDLVAAFRPQAQGLVEGGADLLILETCQDMLEVKAQILAAREAFAATGRRVPLQCSVTLDPTGRMLLGTDIGAALATLERMRVEVIGLNCSTGPDHMRDAVRYLAQNAGTFLHVHPERRPADQRRRPHGVPAEARRRWPRCCASSSRSSASTSWAAAAAPRPSTSGAMVAADRPAARRRSAPAAPAGRSRAA